MLNGFANTVSSTTKIDASRFVKISFLTICHNFLGRKLLLFSQRVILSWDNLLGLTFDNVKFEYLRLLV